MVKLAEAGHFGLKSSAGFYDYGSGAADETRRKRDALLYARLDMFKEEQGLET